MKFRNQKNKLDVGTPLDSPSGQALAHKPNRLDRRIACVVHSLFLPAPGPIATGLCKESRSELTSVLMAHQLLICSV
jgi:hypothetical protein